MTVNRAKTREIVGRMVEAMYDAGEDAATYCDSDEKLEAIFNIHMGKLKEAFFRGAEDHDRLEQLRSE